MGIVSLSEQLELVEQLNQITKTQPSRIEPQRKKSAIESLNSRVIIISPHGQLNAYFESAIPRFVEGGYTDIISESELNHPPFIRIEEREKAAQKPFWIIDSHQIIADQPSPQYLLDERLRFLCTILANYAYSEKAKMLFAKSLQEQSSTKEKIEEIISSLTSDLRKRLEESLDEQLKLTKQRVTREHPVREIIPFILYEIYARQKKIDYITPTPDFSKELSRRRLFDEEGNFLANSVSIADYVTKLNADLAELSRNPYIENTLLFKRKINR